MSKKRYYPQKENKNNISKYIILALAAPILIPYEALPQSHSWARGAFTQLKNELLYPIPESIDEKKIRQRLYKLKSEKYIKLVKIKDKNEFKLELTKKGKEVLKGYEFHDLEIESPNKWDGKWRFVMFDIPEKHRYARDVFRNKLESMDFFRVQQSVWIYPYPCEKELDFIIEFLGIRPGVLLFTGSVNRDVELKKHFAKLGFKL